MTYNVFGGTLNLAQFSVLKFTHFAVTVHCEIPWERVPYLSALEVCSRRFTIQIHLYLYRYLHWTVITIIVQIIDIFHCMSFFTKFNRRTFSSLGSCNLEDICCQSKSLPDCCCFFQPLHPLSCFRYALHQRWANFSRCGPYGTSLQPLASHTFTKWLWNLTAVSMNTLF